MGEGTGKGQKEGERKSSLGTMWSRAASKGPVLLLVHVPVRPGQHLLPLFSIIQNKY